jgi:DNA repair protein RecN (Recombination protein N)
MLTTLRIKNLALVADLTVELGPGYNAITGETGAGKSILIGALQLAVGERADRTMIRSGADGCAVEATFDLRDSGLPIARFLSENGLEPCEDGQLILKRTLGVAGTNRQFINGSPATLAALSTLGDWLVDLHGPHDHQSLLRPGRQLQLLDAYAKLGPLRERFADCASRLAAVASAKTALIVDEATYARRVELLRHQVTEIEAARLRPDEEEELQAEFTRSSNAARILELSQAVLRRLTEDDDSLLSALGGLGRVLLELQRLDPGTGGLVAAHELSVAMLGELQGELRRYVERVEVDPERLGLLEERLNLLQALKRKYGRALEEVIAFGQSAAHELQSLEQREQELERLDRDLTAWRAELRGIGRELTAARRRVIPALEREVTAQLAELGFRRSHFEIALSSADASGAGDGVGEVRSAAGFDEVEFLFAANPGEPPRPLRAIASSGEIARVMLALKTVLAAQDDVPVLIFDEVDANIGGDTAENVGRRMREIGRHRQVLCITHLAPVAARASAHFVVTKVTEGGRTTTQIAGVTGVGRVEELARMLGGPGEAARQHAEALLRHAQEADAPGVKPAVGNRRRPPAGREPSGRPGMMRK